MGPVTTGLGDIFFSIPYILAAVVIMSVFSQYANVWVISLAIGIFAWPATARVLRAEILRVKNADFVMAATALGVDPHRFQFFAGVDSELADTPAGILDDAPPSAVGAAPVVRTGTTRSLARPKLRGSVARPVRPTVRRPGL